MPYYNRDPNRNHNFDNHSDGRRNNCGLNGFVTAITHRFRGHRRSPNFALGICSGTVFKSEPMLRSLRPQGPVREGLAAEPFTVEKHLNAILRKIQILQEA